MSAHATPSASPYCGCLFFTAGALARELNKQAEAAFAPTGLAPSYAFLLMTVNAQPGLSSGEAAAKIALTPSTVTRLIEKLEARGLVTREAAGRSVHLHPTEASRTLDPAIRAAWADLYQRYVAVMGAEFSRELTQQVVEGLRRYQALPT